MIIGRAGEEGEEDLVTAHFLACILGQQGHVKIWERLVFFVAKGQKTRENCGFEV